jgi:hypothetical protein
VPASLLAGADEVIEYKRLNVRYWHKADITRGRKGLNGPLGSPVFACAGKTEPPSHLILSQTSADNQTRRMFTRSEACLLQRCGCPPKRPTRCALVCWRVRSQARCGAVASWPLTTPGTLAVCIREVQKSLMQSSKRLIESKSAALCRLALYPPSTYAPLADMPRASA